MVSRTTSVLVLALARAAAATLQALVVPEPELVALDASTSRELLDLHRKLVEMASTTQHEQRVGDWLAAYLQDHHNYTVEKQAVSKDRFNILAYGNRRETSILVSSHLDVVPPYWPYYYNETLGLIGGRGSVDAKGSVAAQIIAVQGLRKHLLDDISLLFVVGEETGGDGMRRFSEWEHRPAPNYDVVIFGEPTDGKLVCGHKGLLSFVLRATGRAAHSGYPWLGASANDFLVDALASLRNLRHHLPWSDKYGNTTMNLGRVQGGVAANVVAETATAHIATRLAAGTPDVVQALVLDALQPAKAHAQHQGGDLDVEWTSHGYAPVDMDCDLEGFDTQTVNYGTDVPWLQGDHKRYLFGPGSIFVAHSDHEALKKTDLEAAVLDYRRLILKADERRQKERNNKHNDQVEL
ncbi:hypothetical protein ACEQ8H_000130 [Pleosporales sp. CAS-2024a]